MKNSYGKSVSPLQVFLFERFEYDKNGNRITKETVFGKLEYSYDSENRLLSIGTPGSQFVNFVNDRNGNLLKKNSPLEECDYVYDFENRLTSVNVRDIENGSVSSRAFRYDALGRRNAVMNDDGIIRRKLYDGFSFDVLKEGPCFAGGNFTDKYAPEGPWEESSSGGERYRHLNDASSKSRYAMLDSADSESEDFTFFLKPLNVNGQPVAVRKDDDLMYFGKDNLGSVRNISFHNANDSVPLDYDAFGSAVNSFMVFQCGAGYNSKQYDKVSGFYNYGFRDYASSLGRFSSMDPIRDGHNWFVYTNSDPVNFYDPWGLDITGGKGKYLMNEGPWVNENLGYSESETIGKYGCVIAGVCRNYNSLTGEDMNPSDLNANKSYFSDGTGDFNFQKFADDKNLGLIDSRTKNGDDMTESMYGLLLSDKKFTVSVQVKYNEDGDLHWVGVDAVLGKGDGKLKIQIAPTSQNDKSKSSRRRDGWTISEDGKEMEVDITDVTGIVAFYEKKEG